MIRTNDSLAIQQADGGITQLDGDDLGLLESRMRGPLLTHARPGFSRSRRVWNGTVAAQPAIIARCAATEDVVEAVQFAARHHLAVSIRAGGHNVAGTAVVDGGMVIDLSRMNGVTVEPDARIVRVQGGATLADLDAETHKHGLATPTGFVSRTGLSGLLLRGGLGHTMRRWGLSCDNLLAATMVTSDGATRRYTADGDPKVLWALRGGPLELGVVTELELALHPLKHAVRLVMAVFPAEKGVEINKMFRDQMQAAPPELGLISFYGTLPHDDGLPSSVRGREALVLFGLWSGDPDEASEQLAFLEEHDDLIEDLGGFMPYPQAQKALDDDYPDGMRHYWKSMYVTELTDECLEAIHRYGVTRPSKETSLDVWTLGGAVNEGSLDTAAFPVRNATHMIAIEANWHEETDDDTNIRWTRQVCEALSPWAEGVYLNFAGTSDEQRAAAEETHGEVMDRLRQIQERMDPGGLFRS